MAIVELLRALTAHAAPPLRATMLFDDPNLRWRSYGYINYTDLVRHADEHGYHSSMAMIPLDAWRPHPSAVALFRERPDRLSLAMHGNDHRIEELFSQHDPAAALALGAQALRRVERFEAASGLSVGRVMVPPHGMCSSTMARALGRLPFAALASIHPFPWAITPPEDQLLAGWGPATFAEGCPVIPRVLFDSSDAEVALRAYMDHPIVLYGHHDDLADGLDMLAAAAARVNRLGDVRWMAPEEIAHSNVAIRRDGDALSVRPFAQRVRVGRASTLSVESPSERTSAGAWGPARSYTRSAFPSTSAATPSRSGCARRMKSTPPRCRRPRSACGPACAGLPPSRAIDSPLSVDHANAVARIESPLPTKPATANGLIVMCGHSPGCRRSRRWLETEFITLADTPQDFAAAVARSARTARDPQLVTLRREFARTHSWADRAERFTQLLAQPL